MAVHAVFSKLSNASKANHSSVILPYSKLNLKLIRILYNEGCLRSFSLDYEKSKSLPYIKVDLKKKKKSIFRLEVISKPGCRRYASLRELKGIQNGIDCYILSTSKGVLTDAQARTENLGGEILGVIRV